MDQEDWMPPARKAALLLQMSSFQMSYSLVQIQMLLRLPSLEHRPYICREMGVRTAVASEHMARLDIAYSAVAMVMVRSIPNRYMMLAMASNYRQVRSPQGGSNKDGEEQSNLHDGSGRLDDICWEGSSFISNIRSGVRNTGQLKSPTVSRLNWKGWWH